MNGIRRSLLRGLIAGSVAMAMTALVPQSPGAQAPYELLHVFGGAGDGAIALGALIDGGDGFFYGTTQYGGAFGHGTVYRMTPAGAVTILHNFSGADGSFPGAGVVLGADGNLYGTAIAGGSGHGTIFRVTRAGAFTRLHAFGGFNAGEGAAPYAPLLSASDGNLYGVTANGGTWGNGVIFRMTTTGQFTSLYTFTVTAGHHTSVGGLVEANDGWLYGTTRFGLIYRVSPSGAFEVVRLLSQSEGATLQSRLAASADGGTLYGTAREGGPNGFGSIFRVTTSGAFSVIYAFTDGSDGASPNAGLARGPDGNFYGTTVGPYVSNAGRRAFRITPSGTLTVLHTFAPEDSQPSSTLLIPGDGALYGTTNGGTGAQAGRSVAYRISNVFLPPAPPFGSFDTPAQGAGVAGEVPVTGWALDDSGVAAVNVYRAPLAGEPVQANGLVFLGAATFVEGARPDVAAIFPTHPNNTRAGWGYMLLSNMLPNGGNGTFTLHAHAVDVSGNTTALGERTIAAGNSTSPRPFGTIDTPAQGATVSGVIDNFGWALTPQPSAIPADGSTITVFVDGVAAGRPTYNLFRSDIATLFPGYANSNGAVGHFSLDTRTLANGVHILSWQVVDNNGNAQGIGSRYITVRNP